MYSLHFPPSPSLSPSPSSSLSLPPSLQVVSLRKCGISDPPTNYYLAEVVDRDISKNRERELAPSELPYELKHTGIGPLKLYIRAKVSAE